MTTETKFKIGETAKIIKYLKCIEQKFEIGDTCIVQKCDYPKSIEFAFIYGRTPSYIKYLLITIKETQRPNWFYLHFKIKRSLIKGGEHVVVVRKPDLLIKHHFIYARDTTNYSDISIPLNNFIAEHFKNMESLKIKTFGGKEGPLWEKLGGNKGFTPTRYYEKFLNI